MDDDHQTIIKLILYDYQLQCLSYVAVSWLCSNFIFNMGNKPVKHIMSILGNTKKAKILLTAIHLHLILYSIFDKMI